MNQGTYFNDLVSSKYDGGMEKFQFIEAVKAIFSCQLPILYIGVVFTDIDIMTMSITNILPT